MNPQLVAVIAWIEQHLAFVGWPALVLASYKVARFMTKLEARFTATENHITKMATNEVPHIQEATTKVGEKLDSIDNNITGLREDFRTYWRN